MFLKGGLGGDFLPLLKKYVCDNKIRNTTNQLVYIRNIMHVII